MSTVQEIISHPRGLVLMVGPTGSGKSTTLYSIINALNTTDRKIITLEDPIEYGITGISQIPINTTAGGSFAEGLRSVLRLDPDVVMVGEIRDGDTARTAIQASITGHLVLSSFHANSTAAAFARMIDLIGTNPIFASSIRLLIAQRLVRKLSASKEPYEPDAATVNYLQAALAGVEGVDLDHITLYKPVPTDDAPFGYQGRTVIMEQMVVSEDIQAYLRGDVSDVNTKAIEKSARAQGMLTLEQKGLFSPLITTNLVLKSTAPPKLSPAPSRSPALPTPTPSSSTLTNSKSPPLASPPPISSPKPATSPTTAKSSLSPSLTNSPPPPLKPLLKTPLTPSLSLFASPPRSATICRAATSPPISTRELPAVSPLPSLSLITLATPSPVLTNLPPRPPLTSLCASPISLPTTS